jgi:hypothetical protein
MKTAITTNKQVKASVSEPHNVLRHNIDAAPGPLCFS